MSSQSRKDTGKTEAVIYRNADLFIEFNTIVRLNSPHFCLKLEANREQKQSITIETAKRPVGSFLSNLSEH